MAGADVDAALNAARQRHAAGRLAEAEALYQQVLRARPNDHDVMQALGFIALQSGRGELAAARFQVALGLHPGSGGAHCNFGTALRHLGRFEEALAQYDAAIALNPADVVSWTNRGGVLRDLGRPAQAVESLDRALSLREDLAEPWANRGNALRELGRQDEAIVSYDRALARKPDFIGALMGKAETLLALKKANEALQVLDRVVSLRPDFADAWTRRGAALNDIARYDDAVASYDRAVSLNPGSAEAHAGKGLALLELKRAREAVQSFDQALSLKPDMAEAWNNRGAALHSLACHEEAIVSFDHAIALKLGLARPHATKELAELICDQVDSVGHLAPRSPSQSDFPMAWNNRGVALHELARYGEAMASYDRAIAAQSNFPEADYNKAMTQLLLGHFKAGLTGFEQRKVEQRLVVDRDYSQISWSSVGDHRGETVLIQAEQGLGDTIQFCRYAPLLHKLGVQVLFSPQASLRALLGSLDPAVQIVDAKNPGLRYDRHWPSLSLPFLFGTELQTIPAEVPYLKAQPERIAHWRERIGDDGFRIGVSWRGSPDSLRRAFSPALFAPLADIPGVRLISLQRGEGEAELAAYPALKIERLVDLDTAGGAFLDTAAAMEVLDLVISCDTSVAHLAGALARPTWVALKHSPDWRWLLDRADSPWYPTLRLFRQKTIGDWVSVFADMAAALRERLSLAPEGRALKS